ncbi:MAG TPA: hypothetical protein VGD19_12985 [Allosphingosinicella sp.]|jgi:hypothetical protein
MLAAFLLLAAFAPPSGAQATALATARVVRGERISLTAPAAASDRTLRETRRPTPAGPLVVRLVEFQ